MLERAVGERQEGGAVLELQVARDRGVAESDDRDGVDDEDRGRGDELGARRRGPWAASARHEDAGHREHGHQRSRELGGGLERRRELRRDDDRGEADRRQQRARKRRAGDALDEQPAAVRERRHQQRKDEPGYEQ